MELSFLELFLLLWVPGMLHAQTPEPCSAPSLDAGSFLPVQESYPHGTKISYSCNDGYKPAGRGWWGRSTCLDGEWYGAPSCVGIRSCLSPTIPNGKYEEAQNGWYEENATIKVNCDAGFAVKQGTNTARCSNGAWSPLPVCEKRNNACDAPDKIPHGVIVGQEPKEVYAHTFQLEYACEEGYTTGQENNRKTITCQRGRWTPEPSCIKSCGPIPEISNGVVVQQERRSLKYQCQRYYKLVGPETVVCLRGGTWSEVPRCEEDFCVLNAADYPELMLTGRKYFSNGDTEQLDCVDKFDFTSFSLVRCIGGKLHVSRCCNRLQIYAGVC